MKKEAFKAWLEGKITEKAIRDRLSKCARVEKALGVDLDKEYKRDKGKRLIANLKYSAQDERDNKPTNPAFGFKEGARVRFRLTDLRSAVKKYFEFCDNNKK